MVKSAAVVALLIWTSGADAEAQLSARVYASGFSVPVAFVQDPTDRTIQLVVEQRGRIRVVRNGSVLPADFLDLTSAIASGGERGLLGLAFAPDYAASGRFFVNFTNPNGDTVVARFRRSADPLVADPSSRFDLRWGGAGGDAFIAQPYPNHNGGNVAFGPDGYLYIGLGDGGSGDDPDNRAQNPLQLLGKMLRIDINVADGDPVGYQIPADNPFAGGRGPVAARAEIWSFGLRNPWRYSFDDPAHGGTGALIIGDVGQSAWEEIDYEPANTGGRNYGWRYREGAHDHITSPPPAYLPLIDPIHEYIHSGSAFSSVTGGYVYRGQVLGAAYRGRYFFADLYGRVWSMAITPDLSLAGAHASDVVDHTAALGGVDRHGYISSFGVDADGELYLVSYTLGAILKVLGPPAVASDFTGDGAADLAEFDPRTGRWLVEGQSPIDWGAHGDVPVPADYDGNGTIDVAVWRPANGYWYVKGGTSQPWGTAGDIPVPGDYNGDGKADLAVFRPATGTWWILGQPPVEWGVAGDIPVPADYDGDGRIDIAVWRPASGYWYVRNGASQIWGRTGDIPVPADYNGDGRADLAVYRPSSVASGPWWFVQDVGSWTIGSVGDIPVPQDLDGDGRVELIVYRPATGVFYSYFWSTSTWQTNAAAAGQVAVAPPIGARSRPVAGDVDADRRRDPTIFRPSTGLWGTLKSSGGFEGIAWGTSGDQPVASDYDGDGRMDRAVYRPSTGTWWLLFSASNYTTYQSVAWGLFTDVPVPGDIDGDGKADVIVYRPSNGTWWALLSTTGYATYRSWTWGVSTDVPVSGDFDGDGVMDVTVYRPSNGTWWSLLSSTNFATYRSWTWGSGALPVPGDYDGDGVTDIAVFYPSAGTWYALLSSSNFTTFLDWTWGSSGDVPIVGDLDGDGKADIAVYRPSNGTWYALASGSGYAFQYWILGISGDIPVPQPVR